MQKVLNGWQTQAQSSQRELEDAVKLVEELKSKNSHLSGELNSSKNVQQQLQDQLRDKSNQFSQLNDSYNSSKSQESAIANKCKNLEELNAQLREELTRVNKELQKTLKALTQSEETLKNASEHLTQFKAESNQKALKSQNEFNHKIETLEKEKLELNLKLKTVVSTLEVQMSTAINEVSQKLKDSETKRKLAEHEKIAYEKEIKTLNDKFAELQAQSEELFKQKDLEIQKLSLQAKSEKTIHENLASKILSLTQDHGSIQRELNSYQQLLDEKDVKITELGSLNQE
jgi:chromosome segregation ATPase